MNKVIASEGMVEMQAEVLELLNSVDAKLDYRSFLAATMEKVSLLRRVVEHATVTQKKFARCSAHLCRCSPHTVGRALEVFDGK